MPFKQTSISLPKNWPKDIIYLCTLHIPPSLSPELLQTTTLPPPSIPASLEVPIIPASSRPACPCPLVQIKPILDPSHPAHGQYGLFATRALTPSSFVILYLGRLHLSSSSDLVSDYDLSLDRELDLAIDASQCGNEARFINDYRGIRSEGPNAEFRDCWVEVPPATNKWERRIGVFVLSPGKSGKKDRGKSRARGIAKGEEIVVSYGKGFWRARQHQHEHDPEGMGQTDESKDQDVKEGGLGGG
ncbi:uncharacterized protein Z520_10720 [Fonsecaea multimorphosa CBS 102226]|uniref:SET domain-containing protein n=1 Tax=Fonsecaea multimorphosa CBS 102226 TaxID=1442371 RepID=A0A0D2JJZ0_9EURO|nr:uncharacterized protein Z520_10720 [Fonsecaea multimorphosa CBS 102226]KIX93542.1 hypothetical protein Z520_10720 [Fonsecaea multimorphosa CBS 102226]OAL18857.1 hypothetical protein AYO22_10186 [Fonsecaea multimorphosa]